MLSHSNLIFFGTPEFAVPTLEILCDSGRVPAMVISQPSRRAGRGRKLAEPPVIECARSRDLKIRQPTRVSSPTLYEELVALSPLVAIVVAFGQIFRQPLLDLPEIGCINLHASLLPKHRGAAPIQAAIAEGDLESGVTTMLMEHGLDSGPILLQRAVSIGEHETAEELSLRLARTGAELMLETLRALESGELNPTPQDDAAATYAPRLRREDGDVDWNLPANVIANRMRAFFPWPGSRARIGGQTIKLLRARPLDRETKTPRTIGSFIGLDEGRLLVQCGQGTVLGLEVVQLPGRKPIKALEYWRSREREPASLGE